MKICMVFYDMQTCGGLEEYAATLAVGLAQAGHQVSAVSTAWIPPDNQYLLRLQAANVPVLQLPRWLSLPASDWNTKEKILAKTVRLLSSLVYGFAAIRVLVKRGSWAKSVTSARNWLREQLTRRLIAKDWRKPFARLLLRWGYFRGRPDVYHLQGYTSNLLFVIEWLHDRGIPIVYEEHQTPDAQFDWWREFGRVINKATTVVAVSEKSAQALRTVCGVTVPMVVRSPLLPDPLASGWQNETSESRRSAPFRLTTVARLHATKGLDYLLEAFAQVKSRFQDVQLRVYGDGPLHQDLCRRANELGLDGESIFPGPFTDRQALSHIMARTDLFVMASVLEGQPLGIVEAMAYGRPIVCTSVGGIPELIQDGVNGLLCPPKDPACLAAKIQQLIENDEQRASLGRAARKSYLSGPFQPEAVCNQLVAIYKNALRQHDAFQPSFGATIPDRAQP
ncbi:MAG: glycosyltransferase family 4 protein [Anaerolineae bacterium]|nr:glycosyltransferase family 4 protein [Anaerolineae bacterium]